MPEILRRVSFRGDPRFALMPDDGRCRLCGTTGRQRVIGCESLLGAGQSLRRCGVCAAVYLAPDFTAESLDLFYRDHYRRMFPSETIWRSEQRFFAWRGDRAVAELRLARIAPVMATRGHLLEIGSGFGAFLGAAARLHGMRLSAIEPDHANRTRLLGGARPQFVSGLDAVTPESVDVTAAFHVLEHLADPLAALAQIRAALKPDGHAFIEVPNLMQGALSPSLVHPAHLSYFTQATLSRLAVAAGFQIDHAGPHPDGGALAENIWLVLQKRGDSAPTPLAAAGADEIASVDARLDAVDWQPTRRMRLKRMAKRMTLALLGPGPVGEWQRYRQWRQLRRIGWA